MSRQLSYDIVQKALTSDPKIKINFVEARCATCGATDGFVWKSNHNPFHISNKFRDMGWDFDTYRRKKIKCPDCQKTKTHSDTEEFLPKLETFGQRFRWLREHAHLSLDQVAEQAKFDRRILQALETGEEHPFKIDQGSITRLIDALAEHKVPVNRAWLLDTQAQGAILAKNLHKAMVQMNYIETSLAEASRVQIQQIKLLLSGHIATHWKLPEIAKVLGTTPEELMGLPAKGEKPKPDTTELVVLSSNLRASRLREARQAKNLGQLQLAELIRGRDQNYTVQTLKWMLSKIERGEEGGPNEDHLLELAAEFLDVPAEWLLGRTDLPDAVPLHQKIGITETEAEQLVDRLIQTESDVVGLNQLIDEAVSPLRAMAEEFKNTVSELRDRLSRMPLPHRLMVKLMPEVESPIEIDPVPLPVIKGYHLVQRRINGEPAPAPVAVSRPVVSKPATPAASPVPVNGRPINGSPVNGHVHKPANGHTGTNRIVTEATDHFIGFIDRKRQSKQNMFARALERCRDYQEFDIDTVRVKLSRDLRGVLPVGCANPAAYIHALLKRECDAHNGLLTRIDRGRWQFRQGAHI